LKVVGRGKGTRKPAPFAKVARKKSARENQKGKEGRGKKKKK